MGDQRKRPIVASLSIALLLLAVAAAASADSRTDSRVTVAIETTGCAAQNASEPVYVHVWPANMYPGGGDSVAEFQPTTTSVVTIPGGYYRFMMTGRGCWEDMQWVAILPGQDRALTLHFSSFVAKPNTDYDVWYSPRGGIAGSLPDPETSIELIGKNLRGQPIEVKGITQGSSYYFDEAPAGNLKFTLMAKSADGTIAEKPVVIQENVLTRIDFATQDFD